MKKNLVRLMAAAMGAACVLSLAACGGDNGSKTGSSPASSPASAPASSQTSSKKSLLEAETVEDYINTDMIQNELKSMKEELADTGMDIDVTANGNQMIYTFICGEVEGVDADTLGSLMTEMLSSMDDDFAEAADELKEAVEADDASLVVKCQTTDGEELYSKEFFPSK